MVPNVRFSEVREMPRRSLTRTSENQGAYLPAPLIDLKFPSRTSGPARRELQIGGTGHPFNEMKPNSGDAAAEPDPSTARKNSCNVALVIIPPQLCHR
jgi:hypothetical protein